MEEIEKLREIERAEPEKLKERTRLKREKEKVDEFEKFTVECPECCLPPLHAEPCSAR